MSLPPTFENGKWQFRVIGDLDKEFETMSSHFMPVRSTLLGVALVVRSKDGPRFVFHYPPRLTQNEAKEQPRYGTELDPTPPEAPTEDGTSDDDLEEGLGFNGKFNRMVLGKKSCRHVSKWDGDDHFENAEGAQVVPWEHLDAFLTQDLACILTPTRAYHKKCFELTLDPLHFVTYPMHTRDDGKWKKKKKVKKRKDRNISRAAPETRSTTGRGVAESGEESDYGKAEPESQLETEDEGEDGNATEVNATGSENDVDDGGMTMLNLVFILNPNRMEASARVADIFEHVAKDMNKALKYAQHYSSYVSKESDKILAMKEKAWEDRRPLKALWNMIIERSSLATAIRDVYEAISSDNITTVVLPSNPPVRLTVQIPKPYFLSAPPDVEDEAMPGLLITTANCFDSQDGENGSVLNRHFALLLLDNEEKIMAEIQADGGDLAVPLLEYLKILKPTLSFQQTAQTHGVDLSEIRHLAQHLIHYRRAIAVPPLHARDTYVVSPNSDNHKLPIATEAWSKAFPLAPPLTTFLANISVAPRPYKTFVPHKSHRPIYMEMLAWLLRYGWLMNLRNFAWVIVWPEIRYEVDYALAAERIRAAYRDAITEAVEEARSSAAAPSPTTPISSEAAAEKARIHRLREKAKLDQIVFSKRLKPVATAAPSINDAPHVMELLPKVIKDPYRADHVDSLYLQAISKRFPDEKTQKAFMRLSRYFNGCEALEDIALKEGVKRKEAWALLAQFEEHLLTTRHW